MVVLPGQFGSLHSERGDKVKGSTSSTSLLQMLNLDAEHIGKMVAVGSGLTSQLGAHLSFSLVPEENNSFLGFSPSLLSTHPHLITAILRSCSSSRSLFCLSNSLSIFSVATICVSKRCFSSAFLNLSCSKVCCLASSCCRKSTLR